MLVIRLTFIAFITFHFIPIVKLAERLGLKPALQSFEEHLL